MQGKSTFEWFDRVMDQMYANGIRVIVDIPGSPAPISGCIAHTPACTS
jgi:beta-galactosidase